MGKQAKGNRKMAAWRDKDETSLESALRDLRQESYNLRFQSAAGNVPNVARRGEVRREIARILTLRRERKGVSS